MPFPENVLALANTVYYYYCSLFVAIFTWKRFQPVVL